MKLRKIRLIGFLMILMFNSCILTTNKDLDFHLNEVSQLNSSIPLDDWEIDIGYQGDLEHRYELKRIEADTFSCLTFSYFPEGKCYVIDGYVVTYFEDSIYHEVSLLNDDTLYHFIAKTSYNLIKERPPERVEKQFIKGKEFYIKERRIPVESLDEAIYSW